jgi:hypothetical protein
MDVEKVTTTTAIGVDEPTEVHLVEDHFSRLIQPIEVEGSTQKQQQNDDSLHRFDPTLGGCAMPLIITEAG